VEEIPRVLQNSDVHYSFHKIPPLTLILNQINVAHIFLPSILPSLVRLVVKATRTGGASLQQFQCLFFDVFISFIHDKGKCKALPLQTWTGPVGSRRLRLPKFLDNRHRKVVGLSAIRTGRLYPLRKYSWYSFLLEAESTPGP
jgi:hypothetical protein